MAHDVFISHAHQDKSVADAICATLESRRIRCWIAPRDVLPGTPYAESIMAALEGSRVMILVYTADSNNSQHVWREVEGAVASGVVIIPFRIENAPLSRSLKFYISNIHWLDAITEPLERHLTTLAEAVSTILGLEKQVVSATSPLPESSHATPKIKTLPDLAEIADLTDMACRLFAAAGELSESFNRISRKLRSLTERPAVRWHDNLVDIGIELAEIRHQLTRERWRINLLGLPQVGKSSVLARVLNASIEDAPLPFGVSPQKNPIAVRIRPTPDDHSPSLMLRFLSTEDYQKSRHKLCGLANVDPNLSDTEILGLDPSDSVVRGQLQWLLRSYRYCGTTYVTSPPHIELHPYSERMQFTGSSDSRKAALIHDIAIDFPTRFLPTEIELVECPNGHQDLPNADATVIFAAAQNLSSNAIHSLLKAISEPTHPVWLVVTKLDVLSRYQLAGSPSIFDAISELATRHHIPLSQVCLVARDLQSIPDVREKLTKYPQLAAAYDALMTDGGIDRLRMVLAEVLPKCCAQQTEARLRQGLAGLEEKLDRVIQLEAERG